MTDKKVAVVTGGSRGIGRATALHFANAGFVSVSASRSEPPPAPQEIHHIATDVSVEESVSALVSRVVDAYGGIDVLVNCAGIEVEGTIETTSLSEWRRVFDVNVAGTFLCSRAALPHLRRRHGAIVNVASIDGHWAEPGLAAEQGVLSLPTLQFFQAGRVTKSLSGGKSKNALKKVIDELL